MVKHLESLGLAHMKNHRRFILKRIDRRRDSASTLFFSQYDVVDCHRRTGGGAHADAIVDRIVYNAITIKTGNFNLGKETAPQT